MDFILFRFFAFLSVAFVASHAAVSSEDYWRSVLPNTPMPKSITELLPSPDASGTGDIFACGNGYGNKKYCGFAAGHVINRIAGDSEYGNRRYETSAPSVTFDGVFYFLEKDLHNGVNMDIHFTKFTTPTPFLPRKIADSIPFSSNKLPEILSKFSVKQNTPESKIMKRTIDECEAPGNKGEEKYCATSLENMIDFATSKLGKKVTAVSTDVDKESGLQNYKILGSKKLGETIVVCHKQNYAYAVFYCHSINNVEAYTVSLIGNDGTKARAAVICHMDTSSWNPKHMAFQALHVKPGSTVSVCHFLENGSVVWVP
ncbi:BURP domain-containing protein 6-like [Apium graveolens]|uniref:BURP domain-containing protein 6-like n=1 Tax=Apium graveolens TaxID=4045 RepID=UPI003D78D3C7